MKKLILLTLLFLSGCVYVNQDVGLTTYQYDKCEEYYDKDGVYHKDCPTTDFDNTKKYLKDKFIMIREKIIHYVSGDNKNIVKKVKKRCICSKSCMMYCRLSKPECLKKCCHEKR